MKTALSLIVILMVGAGLSSLFSQVETADNSPVESYPARTTIAGITIAVDPHFSDEKAFSAFDVSDLTSRGYFPIRVIITNQTGTYLKIQTRNIHLETSSNTRVYTIPAVMIDKDVLSQNRGRRRSRQGPLPNDFSARELILQSLGPGSVADGFLYFSLPDTQADFFQGSVLHIPGIEEEGTRKPVGPFAIELDPALNPD